MSYATVYSKQYRSGFVFNSKTAMYEKNITSVELDKLLMNQADGYTTYSITGSSVLVFIAGVVVGYIVDGAVIAISGKSSAEWVAGALNWAHSGTSKLFVKSDGKTISHGVSSTGCVRFTPRGNWYCPY